MESDGELKSAMQRWEVAAESTSAHALLRSFTRLDPPAASLPSSVLRLPNPLILLFRYGACFVFPVLCVPLCISALILSTLPARLCSLLQLMLER